VVTVDSTDKARDPPRPSASSLEHTLVHDHVAQPIHQTSRADASPVSTDSPLVRAQTLEGGLARSAGTCTPSIPRSIATVKLR
jgi:hypothetical protein